MAWYNSMNDLKKTVGQNAKNAGKFVEKNITKPIVKTVVEPTKKALDENIGRPIATMAKETKRTIGLEETPIPESVMPKADPKKVQAISDYGNMINTQAGQFNPAAYGPNYFQPQTYTPQTTQNQVGMPGSYNPTAAPATPQQVAAPNMQQVSGQSIPIQDYTNVSSPDISNQKNVINQEMNRLSNPYEMMAGYDPGLRENYVDLATSGLESQKSEAIARLKEEQMKAGNYGSSVGQKAMEDLIQNYDRQVIEAGKEADMMQMQASREDRYANLNADLSRVGAVSGLAGQGSGLEFSESGYNRDTTQLQNDAETIMAAFEREGKQIDNNTAMAIAEFNAGQGQQGFANEMAGAEFGAGENRAALESEWKRYLAGQDEAARTDETANQAQIFNIGQKDSADLRNYGTYQDVLKGLSSYGSNTIDPQSMLEYERYMQQKQDASNRFAATLGTIGTIASAIPNMRTNPRLTKDTVAR